MSSQIKDRLRKLAKFPYVSILLLELLLLLLMGAFTQ